MLTHRCFLLDVYVARSSAARAKRGRVRLANVSFGLNGRLSTKLTKTKSPVPERRRRRPEGKHMSSGDSGEKEDWVIERAVVAGS
jgi:hypothetical protein